MTVHDVVLFYILNFRPSTVHCHNIFSTGKFSDGTSGIAEKWGHITGIFLTRVYKRLHHVEAPDFHDTIYGRNLCVPIVSDL